MRVALISVALGALGAAASAQVSGVSFDSQRVAVKPASGRGIPDVVDALDALGVTVVRPIDYPAGMVLAELLEPVDGVTLAERLAADERIRFATAVKRKGELLAFATPSMLLRFAEGTTDAERASVVAARAPSLSLVEKDYAGVRRVWRFSTPSRTGSELETVAETLAAHSSVDWAEAEHNQRIRFLDCPPLDCAFDIQWGLENTGQSGGAPGMDINVLDAWCIEMGVPTVNVAILDSGVATHSDLNWGNGFDFTPGGSGGLPVDDCEIHGTSVAGVVSALWSNQLYLPGAPCATGEGGLLTGVAPFSPITSFRIAQVDCVNEPLFADAWLAAALSSAGSFGARVTVSSFGLMESSLLTSAYDDSRASGILHVGASGNSGQSSVDFPASLDSVIAVGAIDRNGTRWSSSSYGSALSCVAPGVDVPVLDREGFVGYTPGPIAYRSGTSYAAPHVAGVAALLFSHEPQLNVTDVEQMILLSARDLGPPGFDSEYGNGLVDAHGAFLVFDDAFVDKSAPPGGTGTPGQPFDTVAEGVAAVASGRTVYVAPGTYPQTLIVTTPMAFIANEGGVVIQ